MDSWIILRTSGKNTIDLADYLSRVGFHAWTPKRMSRRVLRAGRKDQRRIDVAAPIMPTFVFAQADRMDALDELSQEQRFPHPPFSLLRQGRRVPVISDRDVQGLKDAENASAKALRLVHEAENKEEAERLRIAAIRSEQARRKAERQAAAELRKALRSERRDFDKGESVIVDEPSFGGMTGIVQSSDGRQAIVVFGGSLAMKIEAWRLTRNGIQAA